MRTGMIGFCLGVGLVTYLPTLPPAGWMLCLAFPSLLAAAGLSEKSTLCRSLLWFLGCALVGAGWHCVWAGQLLQQRLPETLEGQDMLVIGRVVSLPERTGVAQQFQFEIEQSSVRFAGRKVLLNYYGSQEVETGQRWQFLLRLNRPHGFYNPGGFDYEAWLMQQAITAKGYVRNSHLNRYVGSGRFSVNAWRFQLRSRLVMDTADLSRGGIILALVLGDRSGIGNEEWAVFTATGTNHLVVVSGLHIGIIGGSFFLLIGGLWRCLPWLCRRFPAQSAAAVAAITGSLFYALLAGFSLSTQRALIMVGVAMCGFLLRRRLPPSFSLLTGLCVVLSLDPLALSSAGFWLSFCAVGGLLLAFSGVHPGAAAGRLRRFWEAMIRPQVVVFIAMLLPLSLWLHQFSLLSPLANFFAVPLVSLLVVPLCLLGSALILLHLGGGYWLLLAANRLLQLLLFLLQGLLDQNWLPDVRPMAVTSLSGTVLAILACLLLLLPVRPSLRLLAPFLCLPLLLPRSLGPPIGSLVLDVMDVGQGLAVVIRSASHVLVYDTGPRFGDGFDAGESVLAPALQVAGVRQIDLLLVSHGDNDHAGGAAGLMRRLPTRQVITSAMDADWTGGASACEAGQRWNWDGLQFSILHPGPGSQYEGNNSSCVLQVTVGSLRLLLPGDIEVETERLLLRRYGNTLRSQVLIAPHHGSNSSSSTEFVQTVAPGFVVYANGYRNQFGHPHATVRQRYARSGSVGLETAALGRIRITVDSLGVRGIEAYRCHRPRYWHDRDSCENFL